jgi:hypothetical protein
VLIDHNGLVEWNRKVAERDEIERRADRWLEKAVFNK